MSDQLITVAGISDNFKETIKQVREVLDPAGIDCYFEGSSIVFDILISPPVKKQAATYILRKLQKFNPDIIFPEDL